jgi:coenzyme F420-0:L-glutamate ligase/coenzyme F420-1:gamma-L-glutamate ligase
MKRVNIFIIPNFPLIGPGDDLPSIIINQLRNCKFSLKNRDILVIAQKVVSKAEGRIVFLSDVSPSDTAREVARKTNKDERLVDIILSDSNQILAHREDGLLITEQRIGFICANAGVDCSNAAPPDSPGQWVTLLPLDPDSSAVKIRKKIHDLTKKEVAVIINDTQGRPFREGAVGVAIGVAGQKPIDDRKGQQDLFGYVLRSTCVATADEIASAASMVMGQAREATPVVIIRGLQYQSSTGSAKELIRPKEKDIFRPHAKLEP